MCYPHLIARAFHTHTHSARYHLRDYVVYSARKHTSGFPYSSTLYSAPAAPQTTGLIDFERLTDLAATFKPALLICGGSAYPREWDYKRCVRGRCLYQHQYEYECQCCLYQYQCWCQ